MSAKIYSIIFPVFIISLVKAKITQRLPLYKIFTRDMTYQDQQPRHANFSQIHRIHCFPSQHFIFPISHIIDTPNSLIEDDMEEITVNR